MGRWFWNTRHGTYEWRETTSGTLVWAFALVLAVLFSIIVVIGLALLRQALTTDSSRVARVVAAGDYSSLLQYIVELGQWVVGIGGAGLQQYWPVLLIGVPGVIAVWVLRKG